MRKSVRRVGTLDPERNEAIRQLRNELHDLRTRLTAAELLACTDALTSLCNRRRGEFVLNDMINCGGQFCILLIDLDQFKSVNDRWGHQSGDQVLKAFAMWLRSEVRSEDIICRWGGDEFLVIMSGGPGKATKAAKRLALLSKRKYTIAFEGRMLTIIVSTSIGITEYRPGDDAAKLFGRADARLYVIKQKRRSKHRTRAQNCGLSMVR